MDRNALHKLLTNSRAKAFRSCPRKHRIKYELGYVPLTDSEALVLGTLVHVGLEHWWIERGPELRAAVHLGQGPVDSARAQAILADAGPANPLGWALQAMDDHCDKLQVDPYLRAKARAMVRAYDARWGADDSIVPIAVEIEFTAPLINPVSGKPSLVWRTAGKMDVIAVQRLYKQVGEEEWAHDRDRTIIIEHKTTSEDITVGAMYWRKLRMDGQTSTYYDGGDANGFHPETMLWDALKKPMIKPAKATPLEERKFTLEKTVKGVFQPSRLYANQRDTDESAAEFEARCYQDITDNPHGMLVREEIARLQSEMDEYRLDLWHLQKMMRESEISGRAPRNPDACDLYHRPCEYVDVCAGIATLEDETKYRKLSSPHAELATLTEEV